MIELSVITAIVARDRVADQFSRPAAEPRGPLRRSPAQALVDRR